MAFVSSLLKSLTALALTICCGFSQSLFADTDELLEKRFSSFVAGGYDPLTVPPDWFEPTEVVGGGNLADLKGGL